MQGYSLAELVSRMQDKSITLGWDAVVSMNRAKVNTLLAQQYITRFTRRDFIRQISGRVGMVENGSEELRLSNVVLSAPRLSFEKGTLRDSTATATLEVVSGLVSYVRVDSMLPEMVLYSHVLSPDLGFTLTLDIDLTASKGSVSEQGKVVFDIGEGKNWSCNIVNDESSRRRLGDFFQGLFMSVPEDERVYVLGMLELTDAHALAPESFLIRTMSTPQGKLQSSDDYGEGAVVLFVKTKGTAEEGANPSEEALDYLIPNDLDPVTQKAKYSGSMVLSSQLLFDSYIQTAVVDQVGLGLMLKRNSESHEVARSLYAIAGGYDVENYDSGEISVGFGWERLENEGPLRIKFYNEVPASSLTVSAKNGGCSIDWQQPISNDFIYSWRYTYPGWHHEPANVKLSPSLHIAFDPVMGQGPGELNRVSFKRNAQDTIRCGLDFSGWDYLDDQKRGGVNSLKPRVETYFIGTLVENLELFREIHIPDINVLAISNLLFPERNALQLQEARLPGDLLMVGRIDPKETTFTLEPLMPMLRGGEELTFTIRQLNVLAPPPVTWTVQGADSIDRVGSISNGHYTAPPKSEIPLTGVRNIVTATYTDASTNEVVTASALVTVVFNSIVVTPALTVVGGGREPVTLHAKALSGGPYEWSISDNLGTFVPDGDSALFTPTKNSTKALEPVYITAKDAKTGDTFKAMVLLRTGVFSDSLLPAFHPGLPPNGKIRLTLNEGGVSDENTWSVVDGGGTIDAKTGIYTAPSVIDKPYAIVLVTYSLLVDSADAQVPRATFSAYSVIGLSNSASASEWYDLDTFDFEVTQVPTVYANGLQQAKVVVRIKPTDVDGQAVQLSETELNNIRLVTATQHVRLPKAGENGVPEGQSWHYSDTENEYDPYPTALMSNTPADKGSTPSELQSVAFYVQCHKVEDLLIAAELVNDNNVVFYSNPTPTDGEGSGKALKLVAVQPPDAGSIGMTTLSLSEPNRVEGGADDIDLNTLDYYYLKLKIKEAQVHIRSVKFKTNGSMIRWESEGTLEDVHSITGYALRGDKNKDGDTILHIDGALMRRLEVQKNPPSQTVKVGQSIPEGTVLFSLQRRELWQFDNYINRDFNSSMELDVYDRYGNVHALMIGFKGTDRNSLEVK